MKYLDGVVEARPEDGWVVSEGDGDWVGDQGNSERGTLSGIPSPLCHLCHNVDSRLHTEWVIAVENFVHVGIILKSEGVLSVFLCSRNTRERCLWRS